MNAVVSDGKGGFLMTGHSGRRRRPPVWHMNAGGKPRKTGAKARFYWAA
jgi:hypothetical protein